MEPNDRVLHKYLRQVKKNLLCSGKEKKQIIADLKNNIADYLQVCPEATVEDIRAHFGSPEAIARSCVEQTEYGALLKKMRIRKTVIRIVAATAALAILIWVGAIGWVLYNEWSRTHGYIVEYLNGEIVRIIYD